MPRSSLMVQLGDLITLYVSQSSEFIKRTAQILCLPQEVQIRVVNSFAKQAKQVCPNSNLNFATFLGEA